MVIDREVEELARMRLLKRRAGIKEEREQIAPDHSLLFHGLVRNAMTRMKPALNDDGSPKVRVNDKGGVEDVMELQPVEFSDLSKDDMDAIMFLHNAALATERGALAPAFS